MTSEQSKIDERCHICGDNANWLVHVIFGQEVHVTIAVCDNHRLKRCEVEHTENEGLIGYDYPQQKMTDIHYGYRKKTFEILGPEAPGLTVRRPL